MSLFPPTFISQLLQKKYAQLFALLPVLLFMIVMIPVVFLLSIM